MSTNTLVSDFIAKHDEKQRKQPPPTPKEVHARMIEMTNAANGLRYEVARFGDIEQQLKAVHEKMEPLVLKAKELNDLICERVSQASQPWADSRIHEMEELLQKTQQLERENAEQCVLLGKGGERECALLGKVERLEHENAALRADKERLDFLQRVAEEGGFQCIGIGDSALLDFEFPNREHETSDSVRAAIDAARAKEGQL